MYSGEIGRVVFAAHEMDNLVKGMVVNTWYNSCLVWQQEHPSLGEGIQQTPCVPVSCCLVFSSPGVVLKPRPSTGISILGVYSSCLSHPCVTEVPATSAGGSTILMLVHGSCDLPFLFLFSAFRGIGLMSDLLKYDSTTEIFSTIRRAVQI